MRIRALLQSACGVLMIASLAACGGGSSGDGTGTAKSSLPPTTYTIGGTVTGLNSGFGVSVVLTNNSDTLTLSQDGSFTFTTAEAAGNAYDVTVSEQPQFPQRCTVAGGSGLVSGANVNVSVTCTDKIQETVLYNFLGGTSGGQPCSNVIFDSQGDLYGTALEGGASGNGDVYELQPDANGGYTEVVLHSFAGGATDGSSTCSGLVLDSQGDLFGVTPQGGSANDGTAFELKPNGSGGYTETLIHSFAGGSTDGSGPYNDNSLLIDSHGNLYGITLAGGSSNLGTVFELKPDGNGGYTESVLYSFVGGSGDGSTPNSLLIDGQGNLYGATRSGGAAALGTVFELQPNGSGGYTESVLYFFPGGQVGGDPSNLISDAGGDLYGFANGGEAGNGNIFEVSPDGTGYKESVLYNFPENQGLFTGLLVDRRGNLYGTAEATSESPTGNVFEILPGVNDTYTQSEIYNFYDMIGGGPAGGPTFDSQGNLYGTTVNGGTTGYGTVFEIQ